METIIVDGNRDSLEQLAAECRQMRELHLAGIFADPGEALEYAKGHRVDFALLETQLPGMDGVELAKALRGRYPGIVIIFVSACKERIFDGLQMKGDYFVVKPFDKTDIVDALNRARLLAHRQQKRVFIRAFGRFDVFIDNSLVKFSNAKSKELLALCVDHIGGEVSMEEAVDKLWPDRVYDNRVKALYRKAVIDLHRVFEERGLPGIFCNRRGGCHLTEELVECDFFEYLKHRGETTYVYSGEYLFEYSWAEEVNGWLREYMNIEKLQEEYRKNVK